MAWAAAAAEQHGPSQRGRIETLVLENFKSYEGRHEIGPFDKFTCIIGPNGSGKSNVMDAISFCLGIKAKHLRGDKLKDLVYRREEESVASNPRSAHVTLVFRTADGQQLHFGRTINATGTGAYRYGSAGKARNIGHDEFQKRLAEQSIFVKARNFLVFQGDVMDLARRQGADLAGVLETISGSDQLKDEYTRLSRELEVAQEKVRMHFQHRREVENTVALLEKQRAEVERYHALRKQRGELATESALFKLLCVDREEGDLREASEAMRTELVAADTALRESRRQLEEVEQRFKTVETEAERADSQHFVLNSNLEQLKPEISNCKKQASHWLRKLEEAQDQVRREEQRLKGMESALLQVQEDRRKAEARLSRLRTKRIEPSVSMTELQRSEYKQLALSFEVMNSRLREQIREADEQLVSTRRDVESDNLDLRGVQERRARALARLEELNQERIDLESELDRESAARQGKQKLAASLGADLQKFQLFKDSLVEEQRAMRFKLDVAKSRRERLDQVEARQRIADELRERFPESVLGRLSEVVLPAQRRFELALQMSLGNMAEAFVVTTSAAGQDCVQFLKSKKVSCETFLPLDRIVLPKVGPLHLLTQGRDARRLATQCVQSNERFFERHVHWQLDGPRMLEQALEFLLNGTVIVDDLEEAKQTAYHDARAKGLMPRVVTLEGEVVSPNGNMSVQSSNTVLRVEFGGAEQLREIKTQEEKLRYVDKDLATLDEETLKKKHQEADVLEQIKAFEDRAASVQSRLQTLTATQADERRSIAGLAARADELIVNIDSAQGRKAELQKSKEALEAELLKLGKKNFAKLSHKLGVTDVHEMLQNYKHERRKLKEQVEECEDLVSGLMAKERQIEQSAKVSSKLAALQQDCEQYRRDIRATTERQAKLEADEATRERTLKESILRVQRLKEQREQLSEEVKSLRGQVQQQRMHLDEAKRSLKKSHEKLRVLLSIKCGVFRECHSRQIDVPMLALADASVLEKVLLQELDVDELPFRDLELACAALRVDFGRLPPARREAAQQTRAVDTGPVEAEYAAKIAVVNRELQGLSPNMRAVEECELEAARLREIRQRADEAKLESNRIAREFESVKMERIARFTKCFKHVEATVHPFYRDLTSYDGNDGGSAYLDLDDVEEPYNGGITFTACPPGKRFFPMELLSGGERSMASMSLLFAMHSYRPPPFMILDEVDAPFDRKNTGSLVNYLHKLDFQCVVISLKDAFFAHSDSIVGVYKDKALQTSGSLSLPLRTLGAPIGDSLGAEAPLTDDVDFLLR